MDLATESDKALVQCHRDFAAACKALFTLDAARPETGFSPDQQRACNEINLKMMKAAADAMALYSGFANWAGNSGPRVSVGQAIAQFITIHMQNEIRGIRTWPVPGHGVGTSPAMWVEEMDIRRATTYIELARRGMIEDLHATRTVADRYGVSQRQAQGWCKKYPPPQTLSAQHDPIFIAGSIKQLRSAAARYRQHGRSHAALRSRDPRKKGLVEGAK